MAATKKVTAKPVVKATEAAVKTTAPKTEEKKTEVKTAEKKADVTPVEKKEVKPAEKKPVAKKAPAKKTVKKAELKSAVYVQFAGKEIDMEDLANQAKASFKEEHKRTAVMSAGALTTVEHDRHHIADLHVRRASHDLNELGRTDIDLADDKLRRIWMRLDGLDLSGHDLIEVLI